MIYEVTTTVYVEATDEKSAHDKVEQAVRKDCLAYDIVTVIPAKDKKEVSVTLAGENGQRKVVYEKQGSSWIIKDMADNCYVSSCQSDSPRIMMGQSEHHYLNDIFLEDMMFDNFKAKSWSDGLDEKDLQKAIDEYWAEQDVPF